MFRKLFGKKEEKKRENVLPSLPIGFQKTLTTFFGQSALPSMPRSAHKVFQVVTNPDSQALDFVDAIEGDEGLSARMIKIANSVYFQRTEKSESVIEAVTTIGITELRNILGASTLSGLFPSTHPLREQLWQHNLATAVCSREVAARVSPGQESEAFLGGLLHDIGKLLLLSIDTEQYSEVVKKAGREGDFCKAEEAVYPFNHTEVGHFIAQEWHFTPQLLSAIRLHHIPSKELEEGSLPLIIRCADLMAHKLRIGFSSGLVTLQNNASLKLAETFDYIGLGGENGKALLKKCQIAYEEEKEKGEI